MRDIITFLKFLNPVYCKQFVLFFVLTLFNIFFETFSIAMIIPLVDILFFEGSKIGYEKVQFLT